MKLKQAQPGDLIYIGGCIGHIHDGIRTAHSEHQPTGWVPLRDGLTATPPAAVKGGWVLNTETAEVVTPEDSSGKAYVYKVHKVARPFPA